MKSVTLERARGGRHCYSIEPACMKSMSWVGGIFWAGVLSLLSLGGCRENVSPQTPPALLTLPPPEADGSYHLTSEQLFEPYKTDGKAADTFLRGKTVVVEGRVVAEYSDVEVKKDSKPADEPTPPDLFLYVGHKSNGFWVSSDGIVCNFSESERPFLRKFVKTIRRQDRVFVRGTIGRKFGHIFVEECAVVKIIAPAADPSPAEILLVHALAGHTSSPEK